MGDLDDAALEKFGLGNLFASQAGSDPEPADLFDRKPIAVAVRADDEVIDMTIPADPAGDVTDPAPEDVAETAVEAARTPVVPAGETDQVEDQDEEQDEIEEQRATVDGRTRRLQGVVTALALCVAAVFITLALPWYQHTSEPTTIYVENATGGIQAISVTNGSTATLLGREAAGGIATVVTFAAVAAAGILAAVKRWWALAAATTFVVAPGGLVSPPEPPGGAAAAQSAGVQMLEMLQGLQLLRTLYWVIVALSALNALMSFMVWRAERKLENLENGEGGLVERYLTQGLARLGVAVTVTQNATASDA